MSLRAGFGIAAITPRTRRPELNGFAARTQPATRIAAPVQARVVVLESGRTRVVIAACDVLGFRQTDSLLLERAIARTAHSSVASVLLASTHNHSGPVSMPLGGVATFRPEYLNLVKQQLVAATRLAVRDLQTVTGARLGAQSIHELGKFRCVTDLPGRRHWPGVVTALRLARAQGGPITLFHAGIHPYVLGWQSRVLHSDFPLPACAALGKAIFLPGCGADVSPVPGLRRSVSAVDRYGRRLARAAERALRRGKPVTLEPLQSRVESLRIRFGHLPPLPLSPTRSAAGRSLRKVWPKVTGNQQEWERLLRAGQLPRTATWRLHFLRLGELVCVGIPAEVFCETGRELQRQCRVLTVTHAGGNWGYLPLPFAYQHKTYETTTAHHWYRTAGAMAPGTDARVRRVIARVARKLR